MDSIISRFRWRHRCVCWRNRCHCARRDPDTRDTDMSRFSGATLPRRFGRRARAINKHNRDHDGDNHQDDDDDDGDDDATRSMRTSIDDNRDDDDDVWRLTTMTSHNDLPTLLTRGNACRLKRALVKLRWQACGQSSVRKKTQLSNAHASNATITERWIDAAYRRLAVQPLNYEDARGYQWSFFSLFLPPSLPLANEIPTRRY